MSELSARNETPIRATGRTKEQITADFKLRCQRATEDILMIGYDLIEMKQMCEHGEWLQWLQSVEWSERTAQNYMRVARAWDENPKLMAMGYSRTVAVLAAPAEIREQAERGDLAGASAADIKRMSAALKAAESRADEAERGRKAAEAQLLKAPKETVVREVEVEPADYADLKEAVELLNRRLMEAEQAADEAEQRADEAVRQAQDAMAEAPDRYDGPTADGFVSAVNRFLGEVQALPYAGDWLRGLDPESRKAVEMFAGSVWHWAETMLKAVDESGKLMVISGEGAVSND